MISQQASKKTNTRKQKRTDRDVSFLKTFIQRKEELRKVEVIPLAQLHSKHLQIREAIYKLNFRNIDFLCLSFRKFIN